MEPKIKNENPAPKAHELSSLAKLIHEFRAPLNSIIGFSHVLMQNKDRRLSARELNYVERILDNGMHLLDLVNAIIHISKAEKNVDQELLLEDVDVPDMIKKLMKMLEGQVLGRKIELALETPEGVQKLRTVPQKLKIILMNLLSNGIKFTDAGSVKARIRIDPATYKIHSIEIADTGKGIPREHLQHLLQPFSLASSEDWERGYGLGLGITRSLCDQLGYQLEAESTLGKGATFRIIIQ